MEPARVYRTNTIKGDMSYDEKQNRLVKRKMQ